MAVLDVLSHLDFKKANEIQNALIHKLAEAPESPVEGQIYYDTATHKMYVRTNSAWVPLDASQITAGDALTRTGDDFDVNAGTGLEISADTIRIAAAAAGDGLEGGAGSALAVKVGTGIEISSDAVRIAAAAAGAGLTGGGGSALAVGGGSGLTANADDIAVNVGVGIEISSDAVRISAEAAGAGLTGGAGSALAVGAGTGVTVNANDVAVDTGVIATKAYVDSVAQGLDVKQSVRAATTANISLNSVLVNGQTLDGVTLATGDRVLVKDQTDKKENGIFKVLAVGLPEGGERTDDANAAGELSGGAYTFVEEGTVNADTGWVISTNGSITPGTTEHVWVQFTGAGTIIAGGGIGKSGNELTVAAGTGLTQEADGLKVDTSTIATKSFVEGRTFAGDVASGEKDVTIEHNLGSEDVDVTVRYDGGGRTDAVIVDWETDGANKVILHFNKAPEVSEFRFKVSR